MTKRRYNKFPRGTRMRSLELSTRDEYPEPRTREWQRFCRCIGQRQKGNVLLGGQTPARVYRGTPVCARCQSFIRLHGPPEWN